MLFDVFERSLDRATPPPFYPDLLKALWHAAKGDAKEAMRLAQLSDGENGAWVRAHIHRTNGELGLAKRWYAKAGKTMPDIPPGRERSAVAVALLAELDGHTPPFL